MLSKAGHLKLLYWMGSSGAYSWVQDGLWNKVSQQSSYYASTHPCIKPGTLVQASDPSTREVEIEGFRELAAQPVSPAW